MDWERNCQESSWTGNQSSHSVFCGVGKKGKAFPFPSLPLPLPPIFCYPCPRDFVRLPLAWKETEKTATQAKACPAIMFNNKTYLSNLYNIFVGHYFLYVVAPKEAVLFMVESPHFTS